MATTDLRLLTIENLRGSVAEFTLQFSRDSKLTVVYGENGSGKTTICDAIEFLGSGKIGSLEDRGLGTHLSRFWPSIGKGAADVKVTLQTTTDTLSGRIQDGLVTVQPVDKRPHVGVLRRPQILRLIDAQPWKKYEEISRFVDVDAIERAEAAFTELIDDLETKRNADTLVIVANEEQIARFWEAAGAPGEDALAWAENRADQPAADTGPIAAVLARAEQAYGILSGYAGRDVAAQAVIDAADHRLTEARAAQARIQVLPHDEPATLAILEAAEAYLADFSHDASTCPLCRSRERADGLLHAVRGRMESMQELQLAACATEKAIQEARDASLGMSSLVEQYAVDRERLVVACDSYAALDPQAPALSSPPVAIGSLDDWLEQTAPTLAAWSSARVRMLSDTEFIETLRATLDNYKSGLEGQRQLGLLLPAVRAAHGIVREERQKYTDEVLSSIAQRVGELYDSVHPGEGGTGLTMELTPKKRASLDLGSSFGGQGRVPPTAYFSQSHLDTLGICIFLALMERDSPGETILVLDDVLASLDEPHVERLVRMIASLASRFRHCIVTTHYRPWREKLKWGLLNDGSTELLELKRWSLAGGIQLTSTIPEIDRLREDLKADIPDLQSIVSRSGVILEAVLEHITLTYECALPRKRGTTPYTVGDLLDGVSGRLRRDLRVERRTEDASGTVAYMSTALGPLLDNLQTIAGTRNAMGAHFTELTFELLDDDAMRFGRSVLELAEIVVDPEVGWPSNGNSGSYWATKGETRRMHPLRRPR